MTKKVKALLDSLDAEEILRVSKMTMHALMVKFSLTAMEAISIYNNYHKSDPHDGEV